MYSELSILYLVDVPFSIRKHGDDVDIIVDVNLINWSWEIWEAIGLSKYFSTYIVYGGNLVLPNNFDIVYTPHDGLVQIGFEIAKNFQKPLIVQCISAPPPNPDVHWQITLQIIESNFVPFITCVSPFVCREWQKYFKQKGIEKNVIYVPHGVNNIVADKVNICPSERKCFVAIAKLMKHKRIDLLIKTFGKLLRDDLVIIGDGPEKIELEKLNILMLYPAKFLGVVDDFTKFKILANVKAHVHASISEQFSIPHIEASYMATPTLSYKQHVVYEIHQDNPSIFFWENEEELEKLIEKFDNMETKEINEIGLKGREWIIKKGLTLTQRSEKLAQILIEWFKK